MKTSVYTCINSCHTKGDRLQRVLYILEHLNNMVRDLNQLNDAKVLPFVVMQR